MRIRLLGTGAADGWPQPFCRCVSCTSARTHGIARARGGVLIDDVVLIDPSPDAIGAAGRAGVSFADVRTVLVTHAHPDHLDPTVFLAHAWIPGASPLVVHAPVSVLDVIRPWLDPARIDDGTVSLIEAKVGDEITLPYGHIARALPAEHGLGAGGHASESTRDAVLWEVTSPDGTRLLHACDTGPLSEATVALLRPLDVLLLEETFGDETAHETAHLDLTTFAACLAELRGANVISDATTVIATHLSHHNPPESELRRRLAAWGARPGVDLEVIDTAEPELANSLPRRVLVTGGARSGKSREAERLVAAFPTVTYVATAAPRGHDPEWDERVRLHRDRRPANWSTHETGDIAGAVTKAQPGEALLVDCLTLWLTRVIDDADAWTDRDAAVAAVRRETGALVGALRSATATVVMVTNEVGSGIVPESESGRMFRDLLGETNATIARECDEVRVAVAGHVITLGNPR